MKKLLNSLRQKLLGNSISGNQHFVFLCVFWGIICFIAAIPTFVIALKVAGFEAAPVICGILTFALACVILTITQGRIFSKNQYYAYCFFASLFLRLLLSIIFLIVYLVYGEGYEALIVGALDLGSGFLAATFIEMIQDFLSIESFWKMYFTILVHGTLLSFVVFVISVVIWLPVRIFVYFKKK